MQMQNARDPYKTSRVMYVIEAALEYFVSLLVTGAYLARVTASLGFSDSLTGILQSFASLGCLFQLGAITLFRKTKNVKRPIILYHLVNQALFALVYVSPVLPLTQEMKTVVFIVCFVIAYVLSNVVQPPKTAWLMGLVDDRKRGIFTSIKEITSLLGGMTFTFVMGLAFDAMDAAGNTRGAFVLGGAVLFVLTILNAVSLMPVKQKPQETAQQTGSIRELMRNRNFRRVVIVFVLWYAATYASTPFFGSYQIKELGFSMTFISVLSMIHSILRASASPLLGKFADRHSFSKMVTVCFMFGAVSFFVNMFTVPENGSVMYTLYYCILAFAMAGTNSAMTNMIYEYVDERNRSSALAINWAVAGTAGFLVTCLMSPVVDLIQHNGNMLFGITMYPAQFVSGVAFVITAVLIAYVYHAFIRVKKAQDAAA